MALTIRGTEPYIESFKELTGEKTAAGALIAAAQVGVSASAELKITKERVAELERTVATYAQAINNLKTACGQVAELAAQQDMFVKN